MQLSLELAIKKRFPVLPLLPLLPTCSAIFTQVKGQTGENEESLIFTSMRSVMPHKDVEKLRPYPQKHISQLILLKEEFLCASFWALILLAVWQCKVQNLVHICLAYASAPKCVQREGSNMTYVLFTTSWSIWEVIFTSLLVSYEATFRSCDHWLGFIT